MQLDFIALGYQGNLSNVFIWVLKLILRQWANPVHVVTLAKRRKYRITPGWPTQCLFTG